MTNLVKMQYKVQNPPISPKLSRIVKEATLGESLTLAIKLAADQIAKLSSLLRKSRSMTAMTQRKIQAEALVMNDLPSSLIKIDQKAPKMKGYPIARCSRNAVKTRTI